MLFYLDSSAIVKRYKTEIGTPVINFLYEACFDKKCVLSTSFLSVLEVVTTLKRLERGKEIASQEFDLMYSTFLEEIQHFIVEKIDEPVYTLSLSLTLKHGLKAADTIQLATAKNLFDSLAEIKESLFFAAEDTELENAAKKEHLHTFNPSKITQKQLKKLFTKKTKNN
jgi:predicted nucleic acid-binding protein